MASRILMPQAGQSMTEGKIVRWIVQEGAKVSRGDPVLEIETDKANMEVESPADGVLRKVFSREGDVVPVLTPIAVVAGADEPLDLEALSRKEEGAAAAAGEEGSPPPPSSAAAALAGAGAGSLAVAGPAVPDASTPGRVAASPLARKLAQRQGVDLRSLRGSGPRGRIIRRDVEAAAAGEGKAPAVPRRAVREAPEGPAIPGAPLGEYPPPSPRPPARVPLAGMRKAIATALQRSKAAAPHFYATAEIDMTAALAARKEAEEKGLQVSVNDLIVRAAALALSDEPRVNCRVSDEAVEYPADANIGIAVGLEEGLVVPVILRAQTRSLAEIAAESRRIIDLARGGKLVGAGQGTFTISNLGMFGIKCFTAVINPPEGAILAVGKAIERAVPAGRGFLPRMILEATLSADHRAIDGLLAARFLARLKRLLEEPARLF